MLPNEVTGYVDLLLRLGGTPAKAWLVLEAPDGAGVKSEITLAIGEDEIRRALAGVADAANMVSQRSAPSSGFDPLRGIGQRLYAAVFQGRALVLYERLRNDADRRGQGVRLVISTDEPLDDMPWEFLHDGRDFLGLSARSAIIRVPRRAGPRPLRPLPTARVLLVAGLEVVLDEETRLIQEALKSSSRVHLVVVQAATARRLQESLARHPSDILCYLGLGRTSPAGEPGLVVLDDAGREAFLSARMLGQMLAADPPRLIVLGASASDAVARELAASCSSVIGIRGLMDSRSIAVFGRGLFTALLRGLPLEAAVAQGRQEVDYQTPGSREWGLPVVYTQAPPEPLLAIPERAPVGKDRADSAKPAATGTKPLDPRRAAQQRKLDSLLTIRRKNLDALREQKAVTPGAAPSYLDVQIEKTQGEIAQLEQDLDDLAGG